MEKMINTEVVRRIDDLGRVVIPKSVRKELGIVEGDPLVIKVKDGEICLKLYIVKEEAE